MKSIKFFSMVMALVMLLSIPSGVFAAETGESEILPGPGTTPDSPFYFMDKWGKQIAMAFTFGAENKTQRALAYADERMAEIEAMIAQNKLKEATEAGQEFQYCIQAAIKNMELARLKGVDVGERVALMTEKHLEVANKLSKNAPQESQAVMVQARESAMVCQVTALKHMAQGDPEKAAQVNLQLMERQLTRIQRQSEDPANEGLQNRMEEYHRLSKLGQEISLIAKGLGKETAVDQIVGQATAHHLEVLAQVQQKVQGEAQETVQAAIQNCTQNHEQVVTRLREQNQLGPVPAETPIPNTIQNMFQNRIEQSTQTSTQPGTQAQAGQDSQEGTETETETQNKTSTQAQTSQGTQNVTGPSTNSTTGGQSDSSGGSQQGR